MKSISLGHMSLCFLEFKDKCQKYFLSSKKNSQISVRSLPILLGSFLLALDYCFTYVCCIFLYIEGTALGRWFKIEIGINSDYLYVHELKS